MKKVILLIALCLSVTAFSCGGGNSDSADYVGVVSDASLSLQAQAFREVSNTVEITDRKLIKDGRIEFETKDMEKSRNKMKELITKYNAALENENEYSNNYEHSNEMTIRIQADKFELFFEELLASEDKIVNKNSGIRDVTSEYIDVEARLKTKKELESRYIEILKRGSTVSELLEVERALAEVRSEIESMEARLKYFDKQVAYSTLYVRYFKKIEGKGFDFGSQLGSAFMNGWRLLQWFFIGIVNMWAFLVIGMIIFLIIYKVVKKKK